MSITTNSTSSVVVCLPILRRIAFLAISLGTPLASKIGDALKMKKKKLKSGSEFYPNAAQKKQNSLPSKDHMFG